MKKLLKYVTIICVVSAIIAIAGVTYAVSTTDLVKQYTEIAKSRQGYSKAIFELVTLPDGTVLVRSVLPTINNVELPDSSIKYDDPDDGPDDDPDDEKKTITPITGDVMTLPGIGEEVLSIEINTKDSYSLPRTDKDTFSMESTYKYAKNNWKTIANRLDTLESYGTLNKNDSGLLKLVSDGTEYYVAAIVDGFGKPLNTYTVELNTGSFNIVVVDVKSLNDSSGSDNQGNSSYGHVYYTNSKTTTSICAVEFFEAGSSSSLSYMSARSYAGTPVPSGTYVTKIVQTGKLE